MNEKRKEFPKSKKKPFKFFERLFFGIYKTMIKAF